jgi:hypothetical protein
MLPAKRAAAFIDFIVIAAIVVFGLLFVMVLFTSNVTGGGLSKSFSAISESPGCIPSVTLDDCGECGGNDKCCYCPTKCVLADETIKRGAECGGLAEEFATVKETTCDSTCEDDYCRCPAGCVFSWWVAVRKGGNCGGIIPTPEPSTKLTGCLQTCTDTACTCPTTDYRNGIHHESKFPMCYKNYITQNQYCQTLPDLTIIYPYVQFEKSKTGSVRVVKVQNVGGTDFAAPFKVCFQDLSKIVDGLEAGVTIDVRLESGISFGSGEATAVVNCGSPETPEFNTDNNQHKCNVFVSAQGTAQCISA